MTSAAVRPAAVAGMFYPGDKGQLAAQVDAYLDAAAADAAGKPVPKAIIAPHAGYVYSGPVAATAYARLAPARGTITRVVLLGPCHRVAVRGLAAPTWDAFDTPLGPVPVDRAAVDAALALPQVETFDATHADEHSLEVHLPFLQTVLGDFSVVPLVVGDATDDEVAEVLDTLWGGPETLIVVSSDLTHYLPYDEARRIDARTAGAIEHLDPAAIGRDQACGRVPVRGLLTLAKRKRLRVATLDLRNSGDTAGDKSRVVGYGAWVFEETADAANDDDADGAEDTGDGDEAGFEAATKALLAAHGALLLRVAATSIENGLRTGRPANVNVETFPPDLKAPGACFVTLKKKGRLRGCIGSPEAHRPLIADVAENGFAAAFRDPRFPALAAGELADVAVSVSVLSPQVAMAVADEADLLAQLRPGVDGLIIQDAGRRALFLPSVWESLPRPEQFLAHLKAKAGMRPDQWSGEFKAWRFIAEEISSQGLSEPLWTQEELS